MTSQTRDFPLCHGTKVRQGVFRRTDINPAVPSCLVLLQRKERELQVRSKRGVSLIDQVHSYKQIHGGQKRPLESHSGIDRGHIAPYQVAALWQLLRLHRRAASHKKKSAMHVANPSCVVPKLRESIARCKGELKMLSQATITLHARSVPERLFNW